MLEAWSQVFTYTFSAGKMSQIKPPDLISYAGLLGLLILPAVIVLLALVWTLRAKPGKRPSLISPLLCLLLSLAAAICLFLSFYVYTSDGKKLFTVMFLVEQSPFLPSIGSGWWVSAAGLMLVLIASIVALAMRDNNSGSPSSELP